MDTMFEKKKGKKGKGGSKKSPTRTRGKKNEKDNWPSRRQEALKEQERLEQLRVEQEIQEALKKEEERLERLRVEEEKEERLRKEEEAQIEKWNTQTSLPVLNPTSLSTIICFVEIPNIFPFW